MKSSLFTHAHSSPLSLAARLHRSRQTIPVMLTMAGLFPDRPSVVCVCISVYIYVCMYAYTYMHVCVHTYICTYTYIHIYAFFHLQRSQFNPFYSGYFLIFMIVLKIMRKIILKSLGKKKKELSKCSKFFIYFHMMLNKAHTHI